MATTRYVKSTGTTTGTFTKKSAPAKTVAAALKAAAAGDTIEILDAATYAEPELVIDKAITITSTYLVSHPAADPTAAGFNSKRLPAISAKDKHRVIRIQGTPPTRVSLGPITLRGMRIVKGHSTHTAKDPGIGCGGGVVIIDADQVTIDRCIFSSNRTEAAAVTGWPEPDRLALRQAIVDLLGDIFTPAAESAINALIQAANVALKLLGRPTLPLISRATVLGEVAKSFDTKVTRGRPNAAISGQAFGGGLSTVWASPTVSRCLFSGNKANGRGGGVAVTGYGWPTIANCVVDNNATMPQGRSDGGGIGCEVAVPTKLGRDLHEVDLVRFLVAQLAAVRGAIGSPTSILSTITVTDILDFLAWLANPLTPNPVGRGLKAILLDAMAQRWSDLADHALYYLMSTALALKAWDAWDKNEINAAKTMTVKISDSRISHNHAFDDGGGFYASVLSRVALTSTEVSANIADSMGGGIRLSMGSGASLAKCTVKGNASGSGGTRGHDKGGGLAARNTDIIMTDTIFGAKTSTPITAPVADSNISGDAPGGGLAFEAASEGALAGVPDLWSSILVEVFGVLAVNVNIGSGCTFGSNAAGFNVSKSAIASPQFAKGGGVFIVRGDFPDAPNLTVSIASAKTAISGNLALTKGYISRAQTGLRVTSANEVALQNLITHREYTENNWGSLIDGSGTLKF